MPLVKVIRKGVTPSIRKVPTSTAAVMMPMTLDRVGKEAASENEEPTKVEDVADAFNKFKPTLDFKGNAGEEETEFKADFRSAASRTSIQRTSRSARRSRTKTVRPSTCGMTSRTSKIRSTCSIA